MNFLMGIIIEQYLSIESYVSYYSIKIGVKISLFLMTLLLLRKELKKIVLFKNNVYTIPITLLLLYFSITQVYSQLGEITNVNNITFLISCLSVALFEEFFFRVYLFSKINDWRKGNGLFKSIIITSLLFGLAHLSSFFKPDVIKITVITQIILAFGLGVLFQTIFQRFKSVILIVGLHTLINYLGSFKSKLLFIEQKDAFTTQDAIISSISAAIVVVVLVVFSYLLIRTKDKKTIN